MARPSKSANVYNGKISKEEREKRQQQEEKLRGEADNISPPKHLNARQKKIFNYIVDQMEASGILGNLDIYILSMTVIAIDRIQEIEKQINKDTALLSDSKLMASKEKYSKEFLRGCNELSLSPASRAKLGNLNLQAKKAEEDPLLKVLGGDK